MRSGIRLLFQLLQSFFSTWALMKASRMEPGNILSLVFFLLCFLFFRYQNKITSECTSVPYRTARITSEILSVIFTLLYMMIDYTYYIENLTNSIFRIGIMFSVFCGFFFLFYHLLMLLFSYTGNVPVIGQGKPEWERLALIRFYRGHKGLSAFLLCLLCWLPYFLYQYPGIMTPDSINQFEQALGIIPYSNHHPFVHTLLLQLLYSIGYGLTGNMVIGVSFYTVFQMLVLAFSVGYFIQTLDKRSVKPLICFVITLFYALVPYNAVYSITVWKDILFAAALLLFSCSLLRLLVEVRALDLLVLILSGLMLCLFRSNGWYGMLLCLPFLLIAFWKKKKQLLPALLGIFLTAAIIRYPIMNACNVVQPDCIEALSVPTQQIAAVICNHRDLTDEQLYLIEQVVDLTYIENLYVPHFADNMKELVRAGHQDYLVAHKAEFFKLWVQLGASYPIDYLKAYTGLTYGYWYPDSFYLVAEGEGVSATDLGVSHTPLIGGPLVVKAKELSIKLGSILPLYGTIWSMGVAFWIFMICIGIVIVRREKQKLLLYLPGAALFLTVLIATPVATEFRYVYFLIFTLPFYLLLAVLPPAAVPEAESGNNI